jgi:hypothetical protein
MFVVIRSSILRIQTGWYYRAMNEPEKAYKYYQQALSKEIAAQNKRNEISKMSQKQKKNNVMLHTGN